MKLKTAVLAAVVMVAGVHMAFAEDVAVSTVIKVADTSHDVVTVSGSKFGVDFALFKNSGFVFGGGYTLLTKQPTAVTSKAVVYIKIFGVKDLLAFNIGGTAVGGNGATFAFGPAINAPNIFHITKLDSILPPLRYITIGLQILYSSGKIYEKDGAGNTIGNGRHWDYLPWGGFTWRIP